MSARWYARNMLFYDVLWCCMIFFEIFLKKNIFFTGFVLCAALFLLCRQTDIITVRQYLPSLKSWRVMIHSYYGNESSGHNLSLVDRVHVFNSLHKAKNLPVYGRLKHVRDELIDKHNLNVSRVTLTNIQKKYQNSNWEFTGIDESRSGRPHVLSDRGEKRLLRDLSGHNCSQTVRTHTYPSRKKRKTVKVSRQTGYRIAEKENMVIAQPKVVRIRRYTAHHCCQRVYFAEWWLGLSANQKKGVWFSDEMSVPLAIPFNVKNDIVYCQKGEQSVTNRRHATKGDSQQLFSLHWTINQDGVCYMTLYQNMMTVKFFHDTLKKYMKEAVDKYRGTEFELTGWYHDHVTNSSSLYVPRIMNDLVGVGLWMQFAPRGCREPNGKLWIKPVKGRIGYWRNQSKPAAVCRCEPSDGGRQVPPASPQLNLSEYGQGYIRKLLFDHCDGSWTGNVESKMDKLRYVVQELNKDKSYFKKLYTKLDSECRDVIAKKGDHL